MHKTIRLPHLGFAVFVRPRPKNWHAYASVMYSKDGYSCKLLLPPNPSVGAVAHECVHILQAVCRRYNIDFKNEDEHMGYIMQYLVQEICKKKKRRIRNR